jgi:hypothetical protein
MSSYIRAVLRLTFLFLLVFTLAVLVKPTPAKAFTCFSDCNSARQACVTQCRAFPVQPTEGCLAFCDPSYESCIEGCGL